MFRRILVANRGEIAVTIIRACRELGIRSVAVCSEADRDALHALLADETICIGPAASAASYLNRQAILSAAVISDADAIHPGFGFLSENAAFARMCEQMHITFIGPSSEAMAMLGDKNRARQSAMAAGVTVVPGSSTVLDSVSDARRTAQQIGYPVIIKAASGGGGRGMRIVHDERELQHAFLAARAEAQASFGDARVYMERYIIEPRHVEIQLMGDRYGDVVHYGERDCSIQRRNQKLIEESPSPLLTPALRREMGEAAVRLARSVGYEGAGTIEFLVDADRQYYFMEMNTRIQVEHPVTEAVTDSNLIREQILVAAGERLSRRQRDISLRGHAIECRINAEDPQQDFRPQPGRIRNLILPGGHGVRVDTALYPGYEIPPWYDNLLAKVIVHAPDRDQAIARMRRALTECIIDGVPTNIDFQLAILRDPVFLSGDAHIGYIGQRLPQLLHSVAAD